jgi:hypothetical protein
MPWRCGRILSREKRGSMEVSLDKAIGAATLVLSEAEELLQRHEIVLSLARGATRTECRLRLPGKGEHLIQRILVEDQVSVDELGSSLIDLLMIELQKLRDGRVRVITQSSHVTDGGEKKVLENGFTR